MPTAARGRGLTCGWLKKIIGSDEKSLLTNSIEGREGEITHLNEKL